MRSNPRQQARSGDSGPRGVVRRLTRALRAARPRWSRALAPMCLAAVLAAALAPAGQAHSARAHSAHARSAAEEEARASRKASEREERLARNKAIREAERPPHTLPPTESHGQTTLISCTQITWRFAGFASDAHTTVRAVLTIDHVEQPATVFSFDGASAEHTMAIGAPIGAYQIDVQTHWSSTGKVRDGNDIHLKVTCSANPAYTIEKLQRIGSEGSYTTSELSGEVGKTVDYAIVLHNTGNVPLSFSSVSDAKCDGGTFAGGPGTGTLGPGESSTETCSHVLTETDLEAGTYTNVASVTATPPEGDGSPIEQASGSVIVEVKPVSKGNTDNENKSSSSSNSSSSSSTPTAGAVVAGKPNSGVLGFSSKTAAAKTAPALKGPQGCARSAFRAGVAAAGVKSVTFYLDGHRLRSLSARSASNGVLAVAIDPNALSTGAHRLEALIWMTATARTKAVRAARSIPVLHCGSTAVDPKFTG